MNHWNHWKIRALPIWLAALLALSIIATAACTFSITEEDAKVIAKSVIQGQTKFYAKTPDNQTKTVTNITVSSDTAFFDAASKQWNVVLHVEGKDEDGVTRGNDVLVLVSPKGEVLGVGSGQVKK